MSLFSRPWSRGSVIKSGGLDGQNFQIVRCKLGSVQTFIHLKSNPSAVQGPSPRVEIQRRNGHCLCTHLCSEAVVRSSSGSSL